MTNTRIDRMWKVNWLKKINHEVCNPRAKKKTLLYANKKGRMFLILKIHIACTLQNGMIE